MFKQNRVQKNRKAGVSQLQKFLSKQLGNYLDVKISWNMIKDEPNKKKMKNKKYRNVKIFASAII